MTPSPTPDMQECIRACLACHAVCLQTAMQHCLPMGGRHVEPRHLRLMLNCAEICQTSANFMLSDSDLHAVTCGACATVCEACAQSCEDIGGMDACVTACRSCAQACQAMSGRREAG